MKQKFLIGAAVVLAALLVAEGVMLLRLSRDDPADQLSGVPTESAALETTDGTELPAVSTEPTAVPPTTQPRETEPTAAPTESAAAVTEPPAPQPPAPAETRPEFALPYTAPDSGLEIRTVHSYDGIFLEDGSDVPISGVAALIVTNRGDRCIDYAEIRMTGEKTAYRFVLSSLDRGASAVVLEAGKAPYIGQEYDEITVDAAQSDGFEMSPDVVRVEETEDGRLSVTNLSQQKLPCVRIFYKFYLEQEQAYVGGITYTAKLVDLQAGASVQIQPSHYAPGSSKIIMIKTYETDEE